MKRNRKAITAIFALFAVLATSASAQADSSTGRQAGLTNPGFEEPRVKEGGYELVETMPGWKTTDTHFEIWGTGFLGVPAHEGTQFVELNAYIDGTLHQDSTGVKPGSVLEFTFAHRGRNGADTMKLTITDLGADNSLGGGNDTVLFTKEYTTGKDAWAVYDSTTEQKIKALGSTVRFAYGAIAATGGNLGQGNLLDAADFGVGVVSEKPPKSAMKLDVPLGGTVLPRLNQASFRPDSTDYVFGLNSIPSIEVHGAPKDADPTRWSMLHDGKSFRLYFMKAGSASTLYQFAFNPGSNRYEHGFESLPQIEIKGAPSDCDTRRFAMLHDGTEYRLYFRGIANPMRLYQFAFNTETNCYEFGYRSAPQIEIVGAPKGTDVSRWAMLHDKVTYRLYFGKAGSNDKLLQFAFNLGSKNYEYATDSIPELTLRDIPAGTDTSSLAMLFDGETYRLYMQGAAAATVTPAVASNEPPAVTGCMILMPTSASDRQYYRAGWWVDPEGNASWTAALLRMDAWHAYCAGDIELRYPGGGVARWVGGERRIISVPKVIAAPK